MSTLKQAPGLSDTAFYRYHRHTKHTLEKLTASHHHLDWANQPDPFRRYLGATAISLPHPVFVSNLGFFEGLEAALVGQGISSACRMPPTHPADLAFVSHLLFYGMAISAWKQIPRTDHRWALRVNPSSGNLHPTETHLLVRSIDGLDAGAYHYFVESHRLEARSAGDIAERLWQELTGSADCPELILCLTSIFWREVWKYRDRGFRYCQHDMGHALAAIMLSAGVLGWRAEIFGEFPDREIARMIGIHEGDEQPLLIVGLRPSLPAVRSSCTRDQQSFRQDQGQFDYFGEPNVLSPEIVLYHSIDRVFAATCLSLEDWQSRRDVLLPRSARILEEMSPCGPELIARYQPSVPSDLDRVHQIIRNRRSAVDMDGQQQMLGEHLETILVSATRGFTSDFQNPASWSANPSDSDGAHYLIHLFLYIHRVDKIEPGVYYFNRLRQSLIPLVYADQTGAAKFYSCFQDIAADGCFAVSMIADLNLAYQLYGDRGYRYVHYEAGAIGQWLYLSSLALGYESTGIGCFIDDLINQHLDLPAGFEVIYNFTVGRAVLDPRLTTLPAYDFPDPALG